MKKNCTIYYKSSFLTEIMITFTFLGHYFFFLVNGVNNGMLIINLLFIYQLFRKKIKIRYKSCILICLFIILFVISSLKYSNEEFYRKYFISFIVYDIVFFLIGTLNYNRKYVMNLSIVICFLSLPKFLNAQGYDNMGMGYAILPVFLASITGVMTNNKKWLKLLSLFNLSIFGLFYIEKGMRGLILAILIFLFLTLYISFFKYKNLKKQIIYLIILIVSSSQILKVLKNNFIPIVEYINSFFINKFNLKLFALNKIIKYTSQGKLFNGRDFLFSEAIELIKKSPIIGYGIGGIETFLKTYPHNIFIQAMCEVGVFGFLMIFFIFTYSLIKILIFIPNQYAINKNVKEEGIYFILLFISGVFVLNYSGVYWTYATFWFFLGNFMRSLKNY